MIKYWDYKNRDQNSLNKNLANNTELDYNGFEEIVLNLSSSQAPFKKEWSGQIKGYL